MKHLKMLGLLAVAVTALLAFAGTASATTLTSPTGTTYTGTITAESIGSTTLHGSFTDVSCTASHVEGKVETHGVGKTVGGKIGKLSFTGCNFPTTVLKAGSLELHAVNCKTYCTGTLTSSGAEIKIQTSVGECIFTTASTHLGTFTGTDHTGGHPILHIDSANIPRTGGSFLCGSSGVWTGTYTVKTPSTGWLDA
ncbi:MAG TPA: hypothetical protein VN732_04955 [Solirubrobacterales bacterium]|nr:hypothetical protein [Solirubrobacterales bacterium]